MDNLITVFTSTVGGRAAPTVNARSLHSFLDVKSEFRNWIKNRIDDFMFVEQQDFVTTVEIYRGGERRDYHITLDMAKELAMVERSAKGKQARQYFIDCERQLKSADPSVILNDPAAMRGLLLTYTEKVIALEAEVAAAAPKVEALERISVADGSMCITDAAKTLQIQPKELFGWLSTNQWIYRRPGSAEWTAYQDKLQRGVLEHKINTVHRGDGSEKITTRVLVTSKGLAALAQKIGRVA